MKSLLDQLSYLEGKMVRLLVHAPGESYRRVGRLHVSLYHGAATVNGHAFDWSEVSRIDGVNIVVGRKR